MQAQCGDGIAGVPGGQALMVVRILRILRLFRILKLTQYMEEGNLLVTTMMRSLPKGISEQARIYKGEKPLPWMS